MQQREHADDAERAVVVVAAEQRRPDRDAHHERDRHRDRGRDRSDEDVAVLHVRQLVRQHALELVGREHVEDALGDAHDRVVRVAAGGEGVGLLLGRDVDAGHRDVRPLGEVVDDRVEAGGSRPGSPAWPGPTRWRACRRTSRCRRRRRGRSARPITRPDEPPSAPPIDHEQRAEEARAGRRSSIRSSSFTSSAPGRSNASADATIRGRPTFPAVGRSAEDDEEDEAGGDDGGRHARGRGRGARGGGASRRARPAPPTTRAARRRTRPARAGPPRAPSSTPRSTPRRRPRSGATAVGNERDERAAAPERDTPAIDHREPGAEHERDPVAEAASTGARRRCRSSCRCRS